MTSRGIPITDLYARVEEYCGEVPFMYCDICSNEPCAYHYTSSGYEWIAQNVTNALKAALAA